MEKELLKLGYANGRRTLVIEADLARGWKRRHKTYGFFHVRWVPFAAPRDRDSEQHKLWEARLAAIYDKENDQIVRIGRRAFSDLKIKCQLTFIAQPASFADRAAKPPAADVLVDLTHSRLRHTEGLLRAEVDFLDHPWTLTKDSPRRPHIFINKRPFSITATDLWHDLTILLVFHGLGLHRPPPVEWDDGDGTASPGGLPGTSRRH